MYKSWGDFLNRKQRRHFKRVSNVRDYRPVLIIATEGKRTEPDYFNMRIFKLDNRPVDIKVLGTKTHSSPRSVLNRMERYLKEYRRKLGDEAWLVVDTDEWGDSDLEKLCAWGSLDSKRNLAVSNPQFEYWLLLHFEDGNNVSGKSQCLSRLKRHLPYYSKSSLQTNRFTLTRVKKAVNRAKMKDNPPCIKWPLYTGTTVYRVVERIIDV